MIELILIIVSAIAILNPETRIIGFVGFGVLIFFEIISFYFGSNYKIKEKKD